MNKRILGSIGDMHTNGTLLAALSILEKRPSVTLFIDSTDMEHPYPIVAYDDKSVTYQVVTPDGFRMESTHKVYFDYFLSARRYFLSIASIIDMFDATT